MMTRGRKAAAVAGALGVAAILAPGAWAEKPVTEVFPISWTDTDPCTGLPHSFTGQGINKMRRISCKQKSIPRNPETGIPKWQRMSSRF